MSRRRCGHGEARPVAPRADRAAGIARSPRRPRRVLPVPRPRSRWSGRVLVLSPGGPSARRRRRQGFGRSAGAVPSGRRAPRRTAPLQGRAGRRGAPALRRSARRHDDGVPRRPWSLSGRGAGDVGVGGGGALFASWRSRRCLAQPLRRRGGGRSRPQERAPGVTAAGAGADRTPPSFRPRFRRPRGGGGSSRPSRRRHVGDGCQGAQRGRRAGPGRCLGGGRARRGTDRRSRCLAGPFGVVGGATAGLAGEIRMLLPAGLSGCGVRGAGWAEVTAAPA